MAIATCVRGRFGGRGRGFVWLDGGPRRSVVVVHVDLCGWMVVHDVPWRWFCRGGSMLSLFSFVPSSFSVGGDFVVHEMVLSDLCVNDFR